MAKQRKKLLIVDGYNVLRSGSRYRWQPRADEDYTDDFFNAARDRLINDVVNYAPVYKVEEYLPQCIDSILAQTFTNFELLLVDDGSPDRCGEICEEYAGKDQALSLVVGVEFVKMLCQQSAPLSYPADYCDTVCHPLLNSSAPHILS